MTDDASGHPFNEVGPRLDSDEFWYNDANAWKAWLHRVYDAVQEHDPWGLLVMRPDCGMVIVDLHPGWRDRIETFNGRTVWLLRPVGWEP